MSLAALLRDLASLARDTASRVHVVGGAVRDRLLGREPIDLDLLVEGDPGPFIEAIARSGGSSPAIFSRKEPATYRIVHEGTTIDLSAYPPGRLDAALRRRDFTINALAVGLETAASGSLDPVIDVTGGLDDLRSGRIRHISEAALEDDPLRLLRAVRLAVILRDFSLDPRLVTEIRSRAPTIRSSPVERIRAELEIMFSAAAGRGLRLLQDVGLLMEIFPELGPLDGLRQNRWHDHDALEHTLRCVEETDRLAGGHPPARVGPLEPGRREVLALSALYHDSGKAATLTTDESGEAHFYGHEEVSAEICVAALTRLRVASRTIESVRRIVVNHLRLPLLAAADRVTEKALRRLAHRVKHETPVLCLLAIADRRAAGGPDRESRLARLESIVSRVMSLLEAEGESVVSPRPLLSGDDVMRILGIPPGPRVGSVMRWLARLQVDREITDRDSAIRLLEGLPPSRIEEIE